MKVSYIQKENQLEVLWNRGKYLAKQSRHLQKANQFLSKYIVVYHYIIPLF